MNESYYKKADAVLLVYDITDHKSFESIENYYLGKIKDLCLLDIPVILLGNKIDLVKERKVTEKEGIDLALSHKFKFKETSCLKNENVSDAFEILIELWNVEIKKKQELMRRSYRLNSKKWEEKNGPLPSTIPVTKSKESGLISRLST